MSNDDLPQDHENPADLDAWLGALSIVFDLLEDLLPDDVRLDHSAESLPVFEEVVASGAYPDADPHIDDALAAYLGQTLRRVGGGRWTWDQTSHQPLVHADEVLGLPPVAPVELLDKANGTTFLALYETWERAARAYAAAHPGWEPHSEYTPGLDIPPPPASDTERMERWLAEQERAFPDWIARFGGQDIWDFSPASLDGLANAIFRTIPSEDGFNDPQNAEFVDGATWYYGEVLLRNAPSRWEYQPYFDLYGVTRDCDDWYIMPRAHLSGLLQQGHPLEFFDLCTAWTDPDASGRAPTEWIWTGTTWWDSTDSWTASVAGHIRGLLPLTLPAEIILDTSLESVRRLEQIVLQHVDDEEFDLDVAAYLGESLLRTSGGRWAWNREPIAKCEHTGIDDVPLIQLIQLARKWRDGKTFARVYGAWRKAAAERRSSDAAWQPAKPPTPGLDPAPAPTVLERWAAQQEKAFESWIADYGAGRDWDFSYESLQALGAIVLAQTPTREALVHSDNSAFTAPVVWYYGETLRRCKPSQWNYQPCTTGEYDVPLRGLGILKLDDEDYYPLSVYLLQEIELALDRSDADRLAWVYGHWAVARQADRAKKAFDRRGRKKSRRKQPDTEYLAQWLSRREREFPAWVARHGAGQEWDFTVESIEALERAVVGVDPQDLVENPDHAGFLDGAIWYYGETCLRVKGPTYAWKYDRQISPDCYVQGPQPVNIIEPINELEIMYQSYERESTRSRLNRWSLS